MIRRTMLLVCAVVVTTGLGYAVSAQSKPAAPPTVSVFKTPT